MTKRVLKGAGGSDGPSYKDDNLFSKDRAEILLGISEGPIKGVKDNSLTQVYLGDTPVKSPTGMLNFGADDVSLYMCEGQSNQTAWNPVLGGAGQFHSVNVNLSSQGVDIIRSVPASLGGTYDRVDINLKIDRLMNSDEGGTDYAAIDAAIAYRVPGVTSWLPIYGTVWRGKTTSGFKTQLSIYGLKYLVQEGQQLEIKVTRLAKESTDEYLADMTWLGFDTISTGAQKAHPNLAQLHFYANSNEQLSGVPNISAIWDGLMVPVPTNYNPVTRTYDETTPWDGSFTVTKHWTNNPVWLARELVKNTRFGLAAYNKFIRINEYSWYEHAKYCDEPVDNGQGGTQPRYTFNGVLSENRDGTDMLNFVLSGCHAVVKDDNNGLLKLFADRPSSASTLITAEMVQESKEGIRFNYQYTDVFSRANEVRVSFINPKRDWEQDFVSVKHQDAIDKYGLVLEEFEATGCTDSHEATRKGMFRLLSAQTETATVSFSLNRMGLTLEPFQVFLLADPSRHWSESRRADTLVNKTLTFKRPIYFEAAGTYDIKMASTAGIIERTAVVPARGYVSQLVLDSLVTVELAEHFAFTVEGQSGNEIGMAKPFRVLRCDPADSFGLVWAVTAVELNRNKYSGADSTEFIDIDPYSYRRPESAPIVANLTAHIEREKVDGEYQQQMLISWDNPESQSGLRHKVYANLNGSGMVQRGETRGNSFEIRDLAYGNYQVQIFTQSMHGVGESEIVTLQARGSTADDWLADPANLTITVDPAFVGADLLVDVGATFTRDGWPVDLVTAGRVGAFVFEIQTPTGTKQRRSPSRQWLYRYAEMVQDFAGVPPETINISIKVSDHRGQLAGNQPLIVTSEGNPTLTALKMLVRDTNISAVPLWDKPNVQLGVNWYLSQIDSFDGAEFISQSAQLDYNNVKPSTVYYIWAEVTPEFGTTQVYPSITNGSKVTTLSMAEVVLPGLEGSVGMDILDDTLKSSIDKISPIEESLNSGLSDLASAKESLDITRDKVSVVEDRIQASDHQIADLTSAVRDSIEHIDSISETATQAAVDINSSVREIESVKVNVSDVENHLGQVEADATEAKQAFDSAIQDVTGKLDQAKTDIDSAKDDLGDLTQRIDAADLSLTNLGTSIDDQLATTNEKLSTVDADLEAKAKELQELIDQNQTEYLEFRNAIVNVDPDTGNITLDALAVVQEEMRTDFLKVNQRVDAAEGLLAQKAEKTTVDEHGTTLTDVGERLDAAEGLLTQKASIQSVTDNKTQLSEVGTRLDAAEGKLTLKAEAAEVTEQGQRLSAAEQTLQSTTSGVESLAESTKTLSASLDSADQRLTAGIEDLGKVVATEKDATAQKFSELTTEVGDTKTSLGTLEESVNTGNAATNQRLDTMEGSVGDNTSSISTLNKTVTDLDQSVSTSLNKLTSDVGDNASAITNLSETVATQDTATSQRLETMESEVSGNKSSLSTLSKTVTDLDTATSQALSSLESGVGGNTSELNTLKKTVADGDQALAEQISELGVAVGDAAAGVTSLQKVVTDGDAALAQQITSLDSKFADDLSATDSKFTQSVSTLTEAGQALTQQLSQLSSQFESDKGTLSSAINQLAEAVSTEDEALARQLSELATTVEGNASEITELRQVVTGSDSSLAEVFQELHAQLDWVADTATGTTAGLDNEVQARVRGEAEIKQAQKTLVDTDQALAQTIEQLRTEFETEKTLSQSSIDTLKTAVSDQDHAMAQVKKDLLTRMQEGERALEGQLSTVAESITNLDETVQTVKQELEGQVTAGDKVVQGNLDTVAQNLTNLDETVQTVKQELEGKVTAGDKVVQGNLDTIEQLVTDTRQALAEVFKSLNSHFETLADVGAGAALATDNEAKARLSSEASLRQTQKTLANADEALASELKELTATFSTEKSKTDASLTEINKTLANSEQAVSTQIDEHETSYVDDEGNSQKATLSNSLSTLSAKDKAINEAVQKLRSETLGEENSLKANLESNYHTKTDAEQAVSTQIDQHETSYVDDEGNSQKATLSNSLSTLSAKDKAINEAVQKLRSETLGEENSLKANLESNYYTKTDSATAVSQQIDEHETSYVDDEGNSQKSTLSNSLSTLSAKDKAINEAIKLLRSETLGEEGSLKADLESNYYTKTDSATAVSQQIDSHETSYVDEEGNTQKSTLSDSLSTLSEKGKVTSQAVTQLKGTVNDQGVALEGAIQETMDLVLNNGETFLEFEDLTLSPYTTHNLTVTLPDEYPTKSPGFIKGVLSNLPNTEDQELRIYYADTLHKVDANGSFSLPIELREGSINLSLVSQSSANLHILGLRVLSQESRSHYAQWGVKSEVAGLKGGFGFVNDGTKVVFALDVDTLAMYDRETGELTTSPFYIQDGIAFIKEAHIADAVITNKLKVGAQLFSPYIANREGDEPEFELDGKTGKIKGAHFRGGDLGLGGDGVEGRYSGYNTWIAEDGKIYAHHLHALSAYIRGDVEASSLKANAVIVNTTHIAGNAVSASGYVEGTKICEYAEWTIPGQSNIFDANFLVHSGGGNPNSFDAHIEVYLDGVRIYHKILWLYVGTAQSISFKVGPFWNGESVHCVLRAQKHNSGEYVGGLVLTQITCHSAKR